MFGPLVMIIRRCISRLIESALENAVREGRLPAAPFDDLFIERPQDPSHGDFASSVPLKLARLMGVSPLQIAEILVSFI